MRQLILNLTRQYNISESVAGDIIGQFATFAEEQYPSLGNSLTQFLFHENDKASFETTRKEQKAAA